MSTPAPRPSAYDRAFVPAVIAAVVATTGIWVAVIVSIIH